MSVPVVMAAAMVVTSLSLPQTVQKVYAEGTVTVPSAETYQDKVSGFKKYSKVYFGKENKKWYVCGPEDEALVLLCDSANNFGTSAFNASVASGNSYGSSLLKSNIDALLTGETHFSAAEKDLMNKVSIQYPTTCSAPTGAQTTINNVKLYAANAKYISDTELDEGTILVGKGIGSIVMSVDSYDMENSGTFWLRAPASNIPSFAMITDICQVGEIIVVLNSTYISI